MGKAGCRKDAALSAPAAWGPAGPAIVSPTRQDLICSPVGTKRQVPAAVPPAAQPLCTCCSRERPAPASAPAAIGRALRLLLPGVHSLRPGCARPPPGWEDRACGHCPPGSWIGTFPQSPGSIQPSPHPATHRVPAAAPRHFCINHLEARDETPARVIPQRSKSRIHLIAWVRRQIRKNFRFGGRT